MPSLRLDLFGDASQDHTSINEKGGALYSAHSERSERLKMKPLFFRHSERRLPE
jgi:hypothetical protein